MHSPEITCIPKVQESGAGYTLSGKTLDPDSAAARPYLSRVSHSRLPAQGDSTTSMKTQTLKGLSIEVDSPSTSPRSSPVPFVKSVGIKRYFSYERLALHNSLDYNLTISYIGERSQNCPNHQKSLSHPKNSGSQDLPKDRRLSNQINQTMVILQNTRTVLMGVLNMQRTNYAARKSVYMLPL
jgi:hypothetical protein